MKGYFLKRVVVVGIMACLSGFALNAVNSGLVKVEATDRFEVESDSYLSVLFNSKSKKNKTSSLYVFFSKFLMSTLLNEDEDEDEDENEDGMTSKIENCRLLIELVKSKSKSKPGTNWSCWTSSFDLNMFSEAEDPQEGDDGFFGGYVDKFYSDKDSDKEIAAKDVIKTIKGQKCKFYFYVGNKYAGCFEDIVVNPVSSVRYGKNAKNLVDAVKIGDLVDINRKKVEGLVLQPSVYSSYPPKELSEMYMQLVKEKLQDDKAYEDLENENNELFNENKSLRKEVAALKKSQKVSDNGGKLTDEKESKKLNVDKPKEEVSDASKAEKTGSLENENVKVAETPKAEDDSKRSDLSSLAKSLKKDKDDVGKDEVGSEKSDLSSLAKSLKKDKDDVGKAEVGSKRSGLSSLANFLKKDENEATKIESEHKSDVYEEFEGLKGMKVV